MAKIIQFNEACTRINKFPRKGRKAIAKEWAAMVAANRSSATLAYVETNLLRELLGLPPLRMIGR